MIPRLHALTHRFRRAALKALAISLLLPSLAGCKLGTGVPASHQPGLERPGAFSVTSGTIGSGSATLAWTPAAKATGYQVKYGTAPGDYGFVASASATSPFTVTGLTGGRRYYFRVTAQRETGATIDSENEITLVPLGSFAISSLTATSSTDLRVAWSAAGGAASYRLQYGTASGTYTGTVTGAVSPYTISGLTGGQTYYVLVTAIGADGSASATEAAATLPQYLLDFTSSTTLDAAVTYTRAGGATQVGSAGLIEPVAFNSARFDHDPAALTLSGLLVEESRQNLVKYSEQMSLYSAASPARTTLVSDAAVAPDGTTTADKLVEDTTYNSHYFNGPGSITKAASALPYTYSVFAKAAGRSAIGIGMRGAGSQAENAFTICNLSGEGSVSGTIINGTLWSGASATVTKYPNGWYRCTLTATSDTTASIGSLVMLADGSGDLYASDGTVYTGDGSSGVYLWGFQIEQASSASSYIPAKNFVQYSEQLDQSPWSVSQLKAYGSGSTANAAVAPDGTTTAEWAVENGVNTTHQQRQNVTVTPNQSLTFTFYAKKEGRDQIYAEINNASATANFVAAKFDLTNGTVTTTTTGGNGTGAAASITSVGNGWYRCAISGQPDTSGTTSQLRLVLLNAAAATSYLGDNASGIYLWGAQLELGTAAGTYYQTTTSALRGADQAVLAALGGWFSNATGTFVTEAKRASLPAAGATRYTAALTDGTAANVIAGYINSAGGGTRVYDASTQQTDATVAYSPSGVFRAVSSYAANDLGAAGGGTLGTSSASASLPVVNQCWLGSDGSGNYLNGHLRLFQYTSTRAPDAALEGLSR